MYKVLITMVTTALASANPATIQKAAAALSKYIGKPVVATAEACISAIKTFTRGNSTTMMVVANVLSSVGLQLAMDKIHDAAEGNPTYEHLAGEIQNAANRFLEERRTLTGDGKVDTTHGVPASQLASDVQLFVATFKVVDSAQRLVGGLDALRALRAAVFLEEADFDNYAAMQKAR